MIGKKLINKNGLTGTIKSVDHTVYHPHQVDNPWVTIAIDGDVFYEHTGLLNTLLETWSFIND